MRRREVVRQEDQRRVAYKNMVSAYAMLRTCLADLFGCPQRLATIRLSLQLWHC